MWRDSLAVTVKQQQQQKQERNICGFNYGSCKKKGTVFS